VTPRRRRTPRAERTSDVTRFRGVVAAAAVAAVVAVAITMARSTSQSSPGPLARPHAVAGVSCAACHEAPTIAAGCVACHGPHPSTRSRHRELAARGALGCPDCHTGHGGGGTTIDAGGHALRYGAGASEPAGTTAFRPKLAVSVPIIAAAACARCHDLASPRDPIGACLIADQAALGGARPTVCFDEHRAVRDAAGAIAPRAAAWDAARDVATAVPSAPPSPPAPSGPWSWLAIALGMAGLVWTCTRAGTRMIGRRGTRKRSAPAAPATPATAVALAASVGPDDPAASATSTPAAPATPATSIAVAPPRKRLPLIDATTCLGCYACVDACPYDVLEIHRYTAVVARPADCCGLILCEQKCPNGSLAITFAGEPDSPAIAVAETLESRHVPGLYVAGGVGGQPLIRNAVNQGAQAVRAIAAGPRATDQLDLVIVGAGPAGLAAALEAEARGLRYVGLEQATIADSIRSFPRGKLVIDPDLPNTSALWLAEATKEELLARWTRTVREARPAILEGRRVTRIARTASGFVVDDVDREGAASARRAAHVILAIGRRGTPRSLGIAIPSALAGDVHYSLADARSFAGRRVLVVGLGDVAMEAAIALSRQPGTEVVIAARAPEFRRGKARNIAEVRRRVAAGTLRVVWQSEVASLAPGRATLATPTGPLVVPCDSVFVLIGAIPAEGLLRDVGLRAAG
jgi:thioredoxin reductase/NAD-dependent dihydropyrimidine dehydrogenase PreA subunit